MILAQTLWLVLPLVARAIDSAANSTTPDCVISLFDPYRNIRPVCLADLNPMSCERLPIPPQSVPERPCSLVDTQGNSSCIASAIAKSEATLEERLKDLKKSLAQDGVIPDDFVTFEAWKAGQLEAIYKAKDGNVPGPDDKVPDKTSGKGSGIPDRPIIPDVPNNEVKQEGEQKESIADSKANQSLPAVAKRPVSQQKPPPLAPHRYNYASPDCSARIHSASPQSQHASSVLHKSRDRYMLTPCSAKEHWVIIELCDDIRIEAVEVGMFEFFSGIVKEVKVSIGGADDDDIDEEDKSAWQEVGKFVGRSVRGTQLFTLDHPTSFQRFIRLDFLSHYGNEYYCPVSSIKVYGMNQMEAFKWESRKQKESEIIRKRLEEDSKRAQKTVMREGTILKPREETTSIFPTASTGTSSAASSITANNRAPEKADTVDSGYKASTAADFERPEIVVAGTPRNTVEDRRSDQASTSGPSPISVHLSSTSAPAVRETFPHSGSLKDASTASRSICQHPKPTSIEEQETHSLPTGSSSASPSLTITMSVPSVSNITTTPNKNTPFPPGPSRHEAKADTSESIYAYIIRRLNALEGNSTLGMMYMEEQTKATRGILQKLENQLADWKIQMDHSQKAAIQQERSNWERIVEDLTRQMEQRDTLLERETRSLRSHIRQLREQITWEQRRNYLHIAVTTFIAIVLYLNARGRGSSAPEPIFDATQTPSSDDGLHNLDHSLALSSPTELSRSNSPFEFHSRQSARNRGHSYSKLYIRKSSTPLLQKHRYKPQASSAQRPVNDQHVTHLRNIEQVRLSSSLSSAPRNVGPRRLARSAHLHTLSNAGRLQYRAKQDSIQADSKELAEHAFSPQDRRHSMERGYYEIPQAVAREMAVSSVDMDREELDRASASEAEDDIDSVISAP